MHTSNTDMRARTTKGFDMKKRLLRHAEIAPCMLGCNAVVMRLLQQQLKFDRAANAYRKEHGERSMEIDIDLVEIVADMYGVPQDNTVETNASFCALWPSNAYCRDWLLHCWMNVVEGRWSVFRFVEEIRDEVHQLRFKALT
jgi:hypothetical protein